MRTGYEIRQGAIILARRRAENQRAEEIRRQMLARRHLAEIGAASRPVTSPLAAPSRKCA